MRCVRSLAQIKWAELYHFDDDQLRNRGSLITGCVKRTNGALCEGIHRRVAGEQFTRLRSHTITPFREFLFFARDA